MPPRGLQRFLNPRCRKWRIPIEQEQRIVIRLIEQASAVDPGHGAFLDYRASRARAMPHARTDMTDAAMATTSSQRARASSTSPAVISAAI